MRNLRLKQLGAGKGIGERMVGTVKRKMIALAALGQAYRLRLPADQAARSTRHYGISC